MQETKKQNAVNALLAVYTKAVAGLQHTIRDIPAAELTAIADLLTGNPDCLSIQTILAHVVSSGFSYAVYIRHFKKMAGERPEKILRASAAEYIKDLDSVLRFTSETFITIFDDELEAPGNEKKIETAWGQWYDIEQLMEHAIVHMLRHQHQIEKFRGII